MRRKFLSVVLCVCMMLTMAPFAFAAGETAITATTTDLSSGTYILEDDVTLTSGALTIPTGANVTIKLNGKKLTNKDGNHTIVNNGTLTITGSGTVDNISNSRAALYNNAGATATLNGGTYTRSHEAGQDKDTSGGNSYYTLKNFGSMTINSGVTVKQDGTTNGGTTGKYSSLVANGWYDASKNGSNGEPTPTAEAVLTINGGTFSGGLNTIKNDDYGTLTINDGLFKNYAQCAFFNANKATINGGTFVNDGTRGVVYTYAKWNETYGQGILNINGGVFVTSGTSIIEKNNNTATVNITGGVFSKEIPGSTAKGGLYVYPSTNPVAKIGDFKFSNLADAIYVSQTNDTVTLLSDISGHGNVTDGKNIVLDLDGKTLTVPFDCGISVVGQNSKLTIAGNGNITCTQTPIAVSVGTVEIQNGTITSDTDYCTYARDGGTIIVNAGTLTSQDAVLSGNNTTGNMNFIVNGGTLTARQGPAIYQSGQCNLNITGGTLNGGISLRMGQVNISGGTINAMTDVALIDLPQGQVNGKPAYTYSGNVWFPDALYVIGGTYTSEDSTYSNSLNLNITGGTFNCTNGKGSAVAIYDLGRVAQTAKITISGNAKFSTNAADRNAYDVLKLSDIGVTNPAEGYNKSELIGKVSSSITGGYFSTDPSAYCVDGKTGVSTGKADYPYTVGDKADNTTPAPVESATVPAQVDETASADTKTAASSMTEGADLAQNNVIEAAVKNTANNNDIGAQSNIESSSTKVIDGLKELSDNSSITEADVKIVYQTYIDVKVSSAEKSDNSYTELAVELTPMYRVIATKNEVSEYVVDTDLVAGSTDTANAIQVSKPQPLTLPESNYNITLALPTGFAADGAKLSIKHIKASGDEYYTGIVSTEGSGENLKTYVTFTTNGFSPFVIYAASANVASIGNNVYPSFQAAVDAAQSNDEITLLKGDAVSATMTGSSKTIKVKRADTVSGNVKVTVNGESKTLDNDTDEVTFTYTRPSSGGPGSSGGSISTPTTYAVNVNAATNGAVAADKKTASKGTTVTVTASPSKGYVVDAVKVVDKDGKDVAVTGKDGKYVFTMPASAVTVTGSFKAETPAPVALPFTDVKSGNWFYDAVKYAYAQGLMTGTSATTFAPNGTMNRAMIVTVLYRLEKSPAVTGASKFTDVPAGQWYSDAVAWAAANKIVNGYDETTFGPMNAVTREQMAAILFRYEQVKGLENVTLEENLNRFPDQNKISAYAIPALQWAVGQKIINGNADGTLDPTGTATRAQVAQIFTNLLNQ